MRSALGQLQSNGAARKALVIGSNGMDNALYALTDNGDGLVSDGEVRLLGMFADTIIHMTDMIQS